MCHVRPLCFIGDYYRYEEACEAVQESLSSSSLRRKLFLDGLGSSSDSSSPPSPEMNQGSLGRPTLNREDGTVGGVEATSTLFSSPLSCSMKAQTPSTVRKAPTSVSVGVYFLGHSSICLLKPGSVFIQSHPERFFSGRQLWQHHQPSVSEWVVCCPLCFTHRLSYRCRHSLHSHKHRYALYAGLAQTKCCKTSSY